MIAIVNVSPPNAPVLGPNEYEVRINRQVITTFTHERKINGIAQCLRDAADAVDKSNEDFLEGMMDTLLPFQL